MAQSDQEFQATFVWATTRMFAVASLGIAAITWLASGLSPTVVGGLVIWVVVLLAALFQSMGNLALATVLVHYGVLVIVLGVGIATSPVSPQNPVIACGIFVAFAGVVLRRRDVLVTVAISLLGIGLTWAAGVQTGVISVGEAAAGGVMESAVAVLMGGLVLALLARRHETAGALARAEVLEEVVDRMGDVARGDLREDGVRNEHELASALVQMVDALRSLVLDIQQSASQVNAAAAQIAASAEANRQGAAHQTAAVEETRREMEQLVGHAQRITATTREVALNAQHVRQAQQRVHVQHRQLNTQLLRIGDVLQLVRRVGRRSEMLALNASIEGFRVGDAGRGFLSIADEMKRLTEQVMDGVQEVEVLTETINSVGRETVAAVEEAQTLAEGSARLSGEIRTAAAAQEAGASEVMEAMSTFEHLTRSADAASEQTLTAAAELVTLAQTLDGIVARFELGQREAEERRRSA